MEQTLVPCFPHPKTNHKLRKSSDVYLFVIRLAPFNPSVGILRSSWIHNLRNGETTFQSKHHLQNIVGLATVIRSTNEVKKILKSLMFTQVRNHLGAKTFELAVHWKWNKNKHTNVLILDPVSQISRPRVSGAIESHCIPNNRTNRLAQQSANNWKPGGKCEQNLP